MKTHRSRVSLTLVAAVLLASTGAAAESLTVEVPRESFRTIRTGSDPSDLWLCPLSLEVVRVDVVPKVSVDHVRVLQDTTVEFDVEAGEYVLLVEDERSGIVIEYPMDDALVSGTTYSVSAEESLDLTLAGCSARVNQHLSLSRYPSGTSEERIRLGYVPDEVIVRYRDAEDLLSRKQFELDHDLVSKGRFYWSPTFTNPNFTLRVKPGTSPEGLVSDLNNDSRVRYAHLNYISYRPFGVPNEFDNVTDMLGDSYHSVLTYAFLGWDIESGLSGPPSVVAVLDDGAAVEHPDLRQSIWVNSPEDFNGNGLPDLRSTGEGGDFDGIDQDGNGFVDDVCGWFFNDYGFDSPDVNHQSGDGHGTKCAGAVAAEHGNANGDDDRAVAGSSTSSKVMPVKFDEQGWTELDEFCAAVDYAWDNGAEVISISIGYDEDAADGSELSMQEAINRAWNAGCVIVAAAGNWPDVPNGNLDDYPFYPQVLDNVLVVSGTKSDDKFNTSSAFGSVVDVAAPGFEVLTTTWQPGSPPFHGSSVLSGTSFACPQVAALAAILLRQNPTAGNQWVVDRIRNTADQVDSERFPYVDGWNNKLGHGRVNFWRALAGDSPFLVVEPPSIDFGEIPQGGFVSDDVVLMNPGDGTSPVSVSSDHSFVWVENMPSEVSTTPVRASAKLSAAGLAPGQTIGGVLHFTSDIGNVDIPYQAQIAGAPTYIVTSISVDPSSCTPGESVQVAGVALYDDSYPVSSGTATIEIDDWGEWTASLLVDGSFSRSITAPTVPGQYQVVASVSDGQLFSDPAAVPLEVTPVDPPGCYTSAEIGNSSAVLVDGCEFYVNDTQLTFRGDDGNVYVYVKCHGADPTCWLSARFRWYEPGGALYDAPEAPWHRGCDPEFFYSYFPIDGSEMSHMEGQWRVKVYTDEQETSRDYELVGTQVFNIRYDLTQHVTCKAVQGTDPGQWEFLNSTSTFTQQDAAVYSWFRFEGVADEVDVKWRFIEPNGTLYQTEDVKICADPEDEPDDYWPSYSDYAVKPINGHPAADKCGQWSVEFYGQDVDNSWDLLYVDSFLLLEEPGVAPTASLSVTTQNPVEGETFEVSCEATDNTYIESIEIFWDDGALHSEILDGVASGTASFAQTLGPFVENQTIECYARVIDTSGNVDETQHVFVTVADSDLDGPTISAVTADEYEGDGDGEIQPDEQVLLSCDITDPSSVAGAQFLVDSTEVTLTGDYFAVCGPFDAGVHLVEVLAWDGDGSPAFSQRDTTFNVSSVAGSGTWHVATTGSDTTGVGSLAMPFATIQHGIDVAANGDTVLVHAGVYYEHDIVMKSGVCLTSETGLADCVTIDAQQQGRVLYCSGVDSSASVIGFTITGGLRAGGGGGMYCTASSPMLRDCVFSGNSASNSSGGGLLCFSNSTPTVIDCTFDANEATCGAGMSCATSSSPTLTGCEFSGNVATAMGGGMYCEYSSSPTLENCIFSGNTGGLFGGGMECYESSSPTLVNCIFSGNTTDVGGGGMHCNDASSSTLENCTFSSNTADIGGAMCFSGSQTLTDCTFSGNVATTDGGGIYCNGSSMMLTGCTFASNVAREGGGMFCCGSSSPTLMGCTFSGNEALYPWDGAGIGCHNSTLTLDRCIIAFSPSGRAINCYDTSSEPELVCCDIYGNADGDWEGCIADEHGVNGNISADPLFYDPDGGDYRLLPTSPCAYATDCGRIGALGVAFPECPTIASVQDIGNDQGGQVRVKWARSMYDAPGDSVDITGYELYRRQDRAAQSPSVAKRHALRGRNRAPRLLGWDYLLSAPAHGDSIYQVVAPTLCDSTADNGICWSVFLVRATTPEPAVFFNSPPDSGYSVDKLAPAVPSGLLAEGGPDLVILEWTPNGEEDLDHYAVYRDTLEDFDPVDPIGVVSTEHFEDQDPPAVPQWWYRISAWDDAGNESLPSVSVGVFETGVTEAPTRLHLGPAFPNPFNSSMRIDYWIPVDASSSRVGVAIFNASGRRVRTLVDALLEPGVYTAVWDGRDSMGNLVGSGVYFCRLESDGLTRLRRIVYLK